MSIASHSSIVALGVCLSVIMSIAQSPKASAQTEIAQSSAVGEITHSILSERAFQKQRGQNWVLLAGQKLNSENRHWKIWELINGEELPDARGVFLRGMNNGRQAGGNPEEKRLGESQLDEVGSHDHRILGKKASGGAGDNGLVSTGVAGGPSDSHVVALKHSGSETRPKNITVNIYIRIN